MKNILNLLIFIGIGYPLVVASAYFTQSDVIFSPRGTSGKPPKHLDIVNVVLHTHDGERLNAWWQQTKNAKKTVLYFQGNSTNISHKTSRMNTFHKMGVNVLLMDYRGYGKSTGRIKREQDIYFDGMTAWEFLIVEKRIRPKDIIVWGRSLGGGVATEIAQFKNISALVLESTFYSLDELARLKYWFFPTKWLLKFHFENGSKLKNIHAPIIIIHSTEDGYIPFSQAIKLFDSAPNPKQLLKTKGSHLDLFDSQITVLSKLMKFLSL
jgi:fermentation-respiration switch protein FrsA (DUF1100 family)